MNDTYDEAAMMKLVDEQLKKIKETSEAITPVFEKVIDLTLPSTFYVTEHEFVLSYYDTDKPFYGSDFMGTYNSKENYIDIDIKSDKGFELFFDIFKTAPKIDFEHINRVINEFRLMYAFILGKDVVHSVHCLSDIKDEFYWCGNNLRFSVMLFDEDLLNQQHFAIKIFYGICTKTCNIIQTYKYEFKHPEINFSAESYDSIDIIKEEFFIHVAKMMNKHVDEIRLIDYKILPMLNV
jgi:hypothetical protein